MVSHSVVCVCVCLQILYLGVTRVFRVQGGAGCKQDRQGAQAALLPLMNTDSAEGSSVLLHTVKKHKPESISQ